MTGDMSGERAHDPSELQRVKDAVEGKKAEIAKERVKLAEDEVAHLKEMGKIREQMAAVVERREKAEAEIEGVKAAIQDIQGK